MQHQNDHDLLIGMRVTLDAYIIESRQNHSENLTKFTNLETRVQRLENGDLIAHATNIKRLRWQSWIVPAILYVLGQLFLAWLVYNRATKG
jgi:hypothetical protein